MVDYKQVIVVRKDLKWGKGKLAAHAAHAAVGSMMVADQSLVTKWSEKGGKKVVLKINDLKSLKEIYKKVKAAKLPSFLVKDAGLTQLEAGTVTCLGIGPANAKDVDKITGKLKLL
jgi:PTH2 family peptidyl-tRNA hydrolase